MTINERVSPKRLAEIIARAEVCDDSVLTDYRDIESIARELQQYRAAAEPVAWVMKDDLADTDIISTPAYLSFSDAVTKTVGKLIPLYTAPQVTSVHPAKNLELAGWQFKSVNGDWLGLIGEHGKNQAVRESCVVREVFAMADGINDREQVRREHAAWSESTFGNVGPIGPLKHLSKEALEAASEPDDLSEWADMQFLLWDAQRRAGITDEQITQAMVEKLAVNKQREWPEPKDGEPRLHIAAPAVQAEQLSVDTLTNVLRNAPVAPSDSQGNKRVNSPVIPDGWLAEAERLAELHGASFVLFRHGQEPVCADPSKFWFGYDPAAPEKDFREIPNSSTNNCRENAETSTKCWCHTCRPVTMTDMRFVVCPECGNKRCPHANDHRNACTGSNEPGQEGSAYPAAPKQEAE